MACSRTALYARTATTTLQVSDARYPIQALSVPLKVNVARSLRRQHAAREVGARRTFAANARWLDQLGECRLRPGPREAPWPPTPKRWANRRAWVYRNDRVTPFVPTLTIGTFMV